MTDTSISPPDVSAGAPTTNGRVPDRPDPVEASTKAVATSSRTAADISTPAAKRVPPAPTGLLETTAVPSTTAEALAASMGSMASTISATSPPSEPFAASPAMRARRRRTAISAGRWALRLTSLAVAVGAWHLLSSNDIDLWVRFSKVPTPTEVLAELQVQLGEGRFYSDLLASLRRILIGFGLATVTGMAAGVAIGRSKLASDVMRPVLEVVRPIPAIAWVPLAILLFPTGEQGIVFITFLAAFFPVVVSTQHTVRALPSVWEDAVRTMGAGRLGILLRVVLPGSLPGIFAGLSVAMGVGWICVVSAEMISGQFGIGYYTWQSYGLVNYPGVVVGMLSIGVLGLASAAAVELAGRRATRWLPRTESRRS